MKKKWRDLTLCLQSKVLGLKISLLTQNNDVFRFRHLHKTMLSSKGSHLPARMLVDLNVQCVQVLLHKSIELPTRPDQLYKPIWILLLSFLERLSNLRNFVQIKHMKTTFLKPLYVHTKRYECSLKFTQCFHWVTEWRVSIICVVE